jgi:class 3 adenylate cyclase
MTETRKIAAILVADVVGYGRLADADEDRTRGLRSDLIDPAIDARHGRVVKRTGDGSLNDSAAWSTPCAVPSKCRTASSIGTTSRPTRRPAFEPRERQVVEDGQIPRRNPAKSSLRRLCR